MSSFQSKAPRSSEGLKVDPELRPGWITANDRLPQPGEWVYCAEGPAEVVRLLGKTGNGRLLELRLADGRRAPFFAAGGNILVSPDALGAVDVIPG